MDTAYETGFGPGDNWQLYGAGEIAPASGLYKCDGCDRELQLLRGRPFPPSNDHSHPTLTPVKWRLVVKVRS